MARAPDTAATSNGRDVERARAEVEEARRRLADTVEELSAAVDPRPRVEQAKERATEAAGKAKRTVPVLLVVSAVAMAAVVVVRRRRASEAGAGKRIVQASAAKAGVDALRRLG